MEDETFPIVSVEVIADYAIRVRFNDGLVRDLDLSTWIGGARGRDLVDPTSFANVTIGADGTSIVWPDGAHLHSDFLHDEARAFQRR